MTRLMSILGGLTGLLTIVVIILVLKMKKLQTGKFSYMVLHFLW